MTSAIDDAFTYLGNNPILLDDFTQAIKDKYDTSGIPALTQSEMQFVGDKVGVHLFTEKLITKMESVNATDDLVVFCRKSFDLFGLIPEGLKCILIYHDKWLMASP